MPSYVEAAIGTFDGPGKVLEDDLEFQAPLLEGQKTGWFFDQAHNRRALPKYVRKGARVLDVFSYVGAWGVRAARHGAKEVMLVDSSAAALELAEANAARNGVSVLTRKGDAFQVLEDLMAQGERFDVVIIDPPAFAKRKKDQPKALAAYKRLNQLAISLLVTTASWFPVPALHSARGGFTGCNCQGGRAVRIGSRKSWRRAEAPDHPASRDSRDPVSKGLFLSSHRRLRQAHDHLPTSIPSRFPSGRFSASDRCACIGTESCT